MMAGIIPRPALAKVWPVFWPMLERAARRTNGDDEATVRAVIERGDAELWAIFKDGRPVAAVTTQITLLQPEKGCRLWLVGGSRMDEWAAAFLAKLEPWARSWGCKVIWGTPSRAGWRRIVRLMGGEEITMDGKPAWGRRL